jgi:predicted RNA-binding protein associated with RNAse of E/G family
MTDQSSFRPGQTIVLREIWQGMVWSARPEIVVQDKPGLAVIYMPPGTVFKQPKTFDGKRVTGENRLRSEWLLKEEQTDYYSLRLTIPGADYSVLVLRDVQDRGRNIWYINMEDPLRRTEQGFDYLDQILDIIMKLDLSDWHWKDEDELVEAIDFGLITKEKAAAMYKEGERAAKWLQSGKSPFNGWENWRPDPSWKVPVLSEGWDKV